VHRGSIDGYPSPRGGGFRGSELDEKLLRGGLQNGVLSSRANASPTSPQQHYAPLSNSSLISRAVLRVVVLFSFGLAYGALVAHLHDDRNVAPVKMEGLNRESWRYLAFWGAASVAMGSLLPWIDATWVEDEHSAPSKRNPASPTRSSGLNAVEWNDVVRSIGAFIGIAFAIRKTPWSSPLQLSATLALVNPFLWYLLDRSSAGLTLSTVSGILGTLTILLLNPAWVPSPTHPIFSYTNTSMHNSFQHGVPDVVGSFFSHERVGLAIWIGSVFFCSCICFGNIGRLLVSSQQRR